MWSESQYQTDEFSRKKVVLLWEQLKLKLRKSEEDEMARIIGRDLIERSEELRDQYISLLDILNDLEEGQQNMMMKTGFMYNQNDANRLDQKISFLIDTLRKKAIDSGLNEDSLMPIKDNRDRQIYEYLKSTSSQRPQSAFTNSTRPESSIAKATETSMRSSFYSNAGGNSIVQVGNFMEQEQQIVESFKLKNVLELNSEERQILYEIKRTIDEECEKMTQDIDEIQDKLLQRPPTTKELTSFSTKLEGELLRSDSILKVTQTPKRKSSLPRLQSTGSDLNNFRAQSQLSQIISQQQQIPPNIPQSQGQFKKTQISFLSSNSNMQEKQQQSINLSKNITLKGIIPKQAPLKVVKNINTKSNDLSEKSMPVDVNTSILSSQKISKIPTLKIYNQSSNGNSEQNNDKKENNIIPLTKFKKTSIIKTSSSFNQDKASNSQREQSQSGVRKIKLIKANTLQSQKPAIKTNYINTNPNSKKQELYGLDIDFLKGIDLGDMIEDIQKEKDERDAAQEAKNVDGISNLEISYLQEQFGQDKTGVKKLRGICNEYRDKHYDLQEMKEQKQYDIAQNVQNVEME